MKRLVVVVHNKERLFCIALAVGMLALLTGCEEVNLAVDSVLGRTAAPAIAAGPKDSSIPSTMLAKKREPGQPAPSEPSKPPAEAPAKPAPPAPMPPEVKPAVPPATPPQAQKPAPVEAVKPPPVPPTPAPAPPTIAVGKKRPPGVLSPQEEGAKAAQEAAPREVFVVSRDPFKPPTEILPSECPPSMPLCRFDRSQLKLRGVMQLSDGNYKGMVEDPDGRGYFVTPGMQIGGATVTQITNKGVVLYVHKSRQDVLMPLFMEVKEGKEF